MSPLEAAKLLEIAPDATPEQIEARFHELRTRLEEKIGKAPTPGLKAKYRESLEEITRAFETLALAADASALPVLQRQKAEDRGRTAEDGGSKSVATPAPVAPNRPASGRKSGSKEFVIVAIIAVVLLAAGGWWVMKTKAENEEKARIAAEAKAAAEAAAKAEQARIDQLTVQVRTLLAESKVTWEAAEREERDAERRVSELRQEARSLRDAKPGQLEELNQRADSAQRYANWLRDLMLQHPAKLARAKLEELLQAKAIDETSALSDELQRSLKELQESLAASRNAEGAVELATNLPTLRWEFTDPLGKVVQQGMGAARITGLLFVRHTLRVHAPTFGDERKAVDVTPGAITQLKLDYAFTTVKVDGLTGDSRLFLNQKAAVFLPDGSFALGNPADVVAYRPGFLPCIDFLNEGATALTLDWIPTDALGMAAGFLRRIREFAPHERAIFLAYLDEALFAMPLYDRDEWIKLCRDVWSELDQLPQSADRVNGYLNLAWILELRDPKLSVKALEQAAAIIVTLDLESVKKGVALSRAANPGWIRTPEAGRRFFAQCESSQASISTFLYRGYLYCGLDSAADRVMATRLAALSPTTRASETSYFNRIREEVASDLEFVTPLQQALVQGDVTAFNRIAASRVWRNGASVEDLARTLWQFGLPRQATDLLQARSSTWLPYWLTTYIRLGDRLDLLDQLVTNMRGKSNYSRAVAAREFALRGNRTKARMLLENFDSTQYSTVGTHGARALAFALIDDRTSAQAELTALEKSPDLNANTHIGGIADAIYALRRLGDPTSERRLLEIINKKPTDLTGLSNWNWAGEVDTFVRNIQQRQFTSPLAALEGWRSFYQTWLVDHKLSDRDLPVGHTAYGELAMILAHLDRACARERPDASRYQVPWFHRSEAKIKDRTPFYFPSQARSRGVPDGTATIRITVSPEGRPVGYETVSADDPSFAEELKRSAAAWTFFPALEWGQPATGTYEFTGNFFNK